MKKITFKLKNIHLPTPPFLKKIGHTLLSVSTFVAGFALLQGKPWIATVSFLTGLLGTIILNLTTEENGN